MALSKITEIFEKRIEENPEKYLDDFLSGKINNPILENIIAKALNVDLREVQNMQLDKQLHETNTRLLNSQVNKIEMEQRMRPIALFMNANPLAHPRGF